MNARRPRLAYPFTVLTAPDTVRLIAGEDFRYTLTGPGLDRWLPRLVTRLTGADTLEALLTELPEEHRQAARELVEGLYGERVLVDGPAAAAHVAVPEGRVRVLVQDRLDYAAALTAQREARAEGQPFLWASVAPLQRAYVGPLFLPDAGPCFGCLLAAFRRLSPAPELYDALLDHGRRGGVFEQAPFPEEGRTVVQALLRWKLGCAEAEEPPAALYRLHVLELDTMAVSTERVFLDPECPECRGGRR